MHEQIDINQTVTLEALFIRSSDGTPQNPTTITLTITAPDGTVTTVLKAAMTNPSVGRFTWDTTPTLAGVWTYQFVSAGVIDDTQAGYFVVGTATHPGPCDQWLSPDDVFDFAPCADIVAGDRDIGLAARAALAASELLYLASGRQFPGLCDETVRPCRASACWAFPAGYSYLSAWGDCGCGATNITSCGCPEPSSVQLPGPVRGIIDVRVNGTVVDRADYRVDDHKLLVRLDDESWPGCQDLAAPVTATNTFQVRYLRGTPPPESGVIAATDLACDLYRGLKGGECRTPERVTNLVRQGTSLQFIRPADLGLSPDGTFKTGIKSVDLFLGAYGRGGTRRRRGSVGSPDIGPVMRRASTGS